MRTYVRRWLCRVLVPAALVVWTAVAALAQPSIEQREVTQHHAPMDPGKRLVIRHSYGLVRIRAVEKQPEVRVTAERRIAGLSREAVRVYLHALTVSVQALDDYVEVRTERPRGQHKLLTQTTVDLDITVPPDVPVEVNSSFGDLNVEGVCGLRATVPFGDLTVRKIAGDLSLDGKYGKVVVEDVRGKATVTHSAGDVEVSRVGETLTVRNQFASVRVQGIGGRAVVDSRTGRVTLLNISGGAQVTSQHGQVDATRIRGDLSITNRDESVSVQDVQGVVVIANANGPVRARQVVGELRIDDVFGTVEVEKVTGKLTVQHSNGEVKVDNVSGDAAITASNGEVKASGVGGDATVTTTNRPLRVAGVRGSAVLTNSHGLVEVDGVSGDCKVRNEFASVTVQNVRGRLDVFNGWGLVQAELPAGPPAAGKDPPVWYLETTHSNVILGVPLRVGCVLSVEVNAGSIVSDPGIVLQKQQGGDRETAEATLQGGGAKVDIRVNLGRAQIVRRLDAPARVQK